MEPMNEVLFTQIAGVEALYRFGTLYERIITLCGARLPINSKTEQELKAQLKDLNISRLNFGGGWFLTDNYYDQSRIW